LSANRNMSKSPRKKPRGAMEGSTGVTPMPPVSPTPGPPTDWGELVHIHDDGDLFQASPDDLPVIDIHSL
jgi:hypothetical protein